MKFNLKTVEHTAWRAIRAGEQELLRRYARLRPRDIGYKAHRELITTADRTSNTAIVRVLRRETPSFDILSEESAPRQKSTCVWILDPLDGTTNYAAQIPLWGISLAFVCDQRIEIGIISIPLLRERYLAIRGKGAWRIMAKKRERLRVSQTQELTEALGLLCAGYRKEEVRCGERTSSRLALASRSVRRLGAAVVEAAWVATGRADYSILEGVRPWDVAVGALLVREAGGVVTQPDGKPWTLNEPNILFSNPHLTKPVYRLFK